MRPFHTFFIVLVMLFSCNQLEQPEQTKDIVFNPEIIYSSLTDIEGNTYKTVRINDQWWMAQNLATTTYSDGTPILNVIDNNDWELLFTAAYCWYDNDESINKNTYGAIYNWYVVNTNKLCPAGWHVPSDTEWSNLTEYLGGDVSAFNKLKEAGSAHWKTPNEDATNESGFTALPAGHRWDDGGYYDEITESAYWWTSTLVGPRVEDGSYSFCRYISVKIPGSFRGSLEITQGLSVRCVKDED